MFCLPFELGYQPQQLLEELESHVSDAVRQTATYSDVAEAIRQAVQALSSSELQTVRSRRCQCCFLLLLSENDMSTFFFCRFAWFW